MERRAWCLLGVVLLALGAMGALTPATAETAGAGTVAQGYGKVGTVHLPDGKLGASDLPIPSSEPATGTVDDMLSRRLADHGMRLGSPIMIRIFKSEAELEVWMKAGERFELLATYAICNWAGTLGPKLREGDNQSPEGLYSVGRRQLRHSRRWRRSLDIGYPNAFDRAHARTGSYILLHGGCTSTGCFAMTDRAIEEIFRLSEAALRNGQASIAVHIFPFRMTPENMAAHADSPWQDFWTNLKEAYDLFERTRLPPTVKVCDRRYVVSEADGRNGCLDEAVALDGAQPLAAPTHRVAHSKAVHRHRPVRSARAAYAAARQMRLALRASRAGKRPKPQHAGAASYRRLPR